MVPFGTNKTNNFSNTDTFLYSGHCVRTVNTRCLPGNIPVPSSADCPV